MQDIAFVCKNRDRKKGENTVTIHYKNVSVLIKLIYGQLIIKLQPHARYCTCLLKQRQKERRKHSNNSLQERLRTHKVHITDIR